MINLYEKIGWQLSQYEDPVIVMSNLLWKRAWPSYHPIPKDGAVLPAPDGSGLTVIIDNNVPPLDLMIVERAERS